MGRFKYQLWKETAVICSDLGGKIVLFAIYSLSADLKGGESFRYEESPGS